jgi:beta-glucosidase
MKIDRIPKQLALVALLAAPLAPAAPQPATWPHVATAYPRDAALEAQVARIVAGMTLEQKVGQMTQAEIKWATPDDVRRYYLGSILNGGGSWPNGNKHASAADWVALAQRYYEASMATDMAVKVPVVWGIDAIHGNSNVYGATLFPHNIGLGAAHDPALVRRVGAAVGKAVRATGIGWVFAPTLAVVQDDRWGRTYESFSEDPALVKAYGAAYVEGLQGHFGDDANVIATAKHFIGDGGTDQGKDRGQNRAPLARMIGVHAQGYAGALGAGAQTVMASFNSWNDVAAGVDYGKMHGSRALLTGVLKEQMGFDGLVVSDWNGIAEVPGCRDDSCPQAINAGIDMVMAPDHWKSFIANTVAQVKSGAIPMARIDDAVSRILRVKLRAGLFGKAPSASVYAGHDEALQDRALARQAVRESLVLLKNNGHVLPLARGKRILVVGKSADSLPLQTGGWSLTWQGTDNTNADFPNGETILAGIRAAGAAEVRYSADARGVDPARFDAVIAVIGETPYAEGDGDIGPAGTLRHSSRYPEDLAVLRAVAGKGVPVVTVLLSGRPLYVNDLLNLSDSFVAAWLPGTEGGGVADVLFRDAQGKAHDFAGKLSFSWPGAPCQTPLNIGDANYHPLFAPGHGLSYARGARVPKLDVRFPAGGCGKSSALPVFNQADRATYPLSLEDATGQVALGADLNAVFRLPNASVETAQVNTQQDAKRVTWTGPARLQAKAVGPIPVPAYARKDGALRFDTLVSAAPKGKLTLAMGCGAGCAGTLDVTALFTRLADGARHTVKLPLACFVARGADLDRIDTPFSIASDGAFSAAFTNIELAGGAAKDQDALRCDGSAQ